MSNSKVCSIAGCYKESIGRGWCSTHYQRWMRHGDAEFPVIEKHPRGTSLIYLQEIAAKCTDSACLTWPFYRMPDGRGQVCYHGKRMQAHRATCIEAHGPPPTEKHEAAHNCGKGHEACVNGSHLQWKTKLENEADKIIHETLLTGEKHNMVKLTEQQALEIMKKGKTCSATPLAKKYGVSIQAIYDIRQGRTWRYLIRKTLTNQ